MTKKTQLQDFYSDTDEIPDLDTIFDVKFNDDFTHNFYFVFYDTQNKYQIISDLSQKQKDLINQRVKQIKINQTEKAKKEFASMKKKGDEMLLTDEIQLMLQGRGSLSIKGNQIIISKFEANYGGGFAENQKMELEKDILSFVRRRCLNKKFEVLFI